MRITLLLILLISLFSSGAQAEDFVASVKSAQGEVLVFRQGEAHTVEPGDHILLSDVLQTKDGSLGVLFRDDTALSLGPDTEINVRDFVFDPHGGNLDFLLQITKGSAAFVTGQLGKIKPEAFKVETPQATIGVRGTRFVVDVR
ncbi:MAG: FecR domain-containing protein [Desulfovibrio sp.]